MEKPLVSIVLGSFNRCSFLKTTLKSVRTNGQKFPYEIIVVDGGSTDGSVHYLTRQKDVITIVQHNRGFVHGKKIERRSWGYFMNLAFKAAQGKFILMMSDDCLLIPGAINNGVMEFERQLSDKKKIGALAFYWRNWPEQKEYWVGQTLGGKVFVNHGLYLRSALEEVGWIDEDTYNFYHADGDLCLKLWHAGYFVEGCNTSFVEHFNHLKSNPISNEQDWIEYLKKWNGIFYHENQDNIDGWIYQSFEDPYATYKKFPIIMRLKLEAEKINRFIAKVLDNLRMKVKKNVK